MCCPEEDKFPELFYETFNGLADVFNKCGDMQMSTSYLEKAALMASRMAKEKETGSVTVLPEVHLNLCNAFVFLNEK
jgi:hypothetical protein